MSKYQYDPNQVALMGTKTHFVKWVKDEWGDDNLIAVCAPGGKSYSRVLIDQYHICQLRPGPPTCKKCLAMMKSNQRERPATSTKLP